MAGVDALKSLFDAATAALRARVLLVLEYALTVAARAAGINAQDPIDSASCRSQRVYPHAPARLGDRNTHGHTLGNS